MEQIILFTILSLFPLGQLIKIGFINPIDVLVFVASLITFIKSKKESPIYKYFYDFLFVAVFTFLVSIPTFGFQGVAQGFLYLVRLVSYLYFVNFIFNLKNKEKVIDYLLLTITASAVFGWIQYFGFPDLTFMKWFNWDDHLFRLTGTFFDPTFTSLVFVVGFFIALSKNKNWLSLLFLISIVFTYSRAGYLALVAGLLVHAFLTRKVKILILSIILLVTVVLNLPTRTGEGVNLGRTASVNARLINYREGISQFIKSPLYGLGFNNLCLARNSNSHSCSAYDAGILTILATTGVMGLISFIRVIYHLFTKTDNLFKTILGSILVHSFFGNTLFYPWILFLLITLLGVSLNQKLFNKEKS